MKIVIVLAAVVFLAACSAEQVPPAPADVAPADVAPADTAAATAQILARADAVDGEEDRVVSRCAGCALAMPGDPAHTLDVDGYTMHFCSDHCRDGFADETDAKLMAMEFPQTDQADQAE